MAFQPHFKPVPGFGHVIESWQEWWRAAVKGTVDQAAVIASRREEWRWGGVRVPPGVHAAVPRVS